MSYRFNAFHDTKVNNYPHQNVSSENRPYNSTQIIDSIGNFQNFIAENEIWDMIHTLTIWTELRNIIKHFGIHIQILQTCKLHLIAVCVYNLLFNDYLSCWNLTSKLLAQFCIIYLFNRCPWTAFYGRKRKRLIGVTVTRSVRNWNLNVSVWVN